MTRCWFCSAVLSKTNKVVYDPILKHAIGCYWCQPQLADKTEKKKN